MATRKSKSWRNRGRQRLPSVTHTNTKSRSWYFEYESDDFDWAIAKYPLRQDWARNFVYGWPKSHALVVYYYLDPWGDVEAFCTHVEYDGPVEYLYGWSHDHLPWDTADTDDITELPHQRDCYDLPTRLTYVADRLIWSSIIHDEKSPFELSRRLAESLQTAPNRCMVCMTYLRGEVLRPTLCESSRCYDEYLKSDLELRIEEYKMNQWVINLLLAAVYVVAAERDVTLLPRFPKHRLRSCSDVIRILDALPSVSRPGLSNQQVDAYLRSRSIRPEEVDLLVSWVCIRFRGFVMPADRPYHIQGPWDMVQYILMNAQPEIEAAFAQHRARTPRHILYHGTSIDRLYSVLVNGLKTLSGTPLQSHGAKYGNGIYLAREPAYALSYAWGKNPHVDSPFFRHRGTLRNIGVLLAVEHAGNDERGSVSPQGIHVITDPTRIMVRYIFLVRYGTRIPTALELNGPILRNLQRLRDTL